MTLDFKFFPVRSSYKYDPGPGNFLLLANAYSPLGSRAANE